VIDDGRPDPHFPNDSEIPNTYPICLRGDVMKKEVSCRALDVIFNGLPKKHLPPEAVCTGISYDLKHLRDKNERIEWDVYCRILSNAGAIWSRAELVELGYSVPKTRLWRPPAIIAKFLFTTTELYTWFNAPGKIGGGRQLFSCVLPEIKRITENHLRLTLTIQQGYQDCPEFFLIAKGGLALAPTVIGLSPASVEMHERERGAVYAIRYTDTRSALSWVRRMVMWPFDARIATRELKEANEVLLERYGQLEEANIAVQRQASQLKEEYRNRERMQQEFSRKQIESQEEERKRLASELHDGLGQDLLMVNNELQQFLNNLDGSHNDLQRVASLVQESIEGIREISSNLHPHHIERLGFRAAVEAMADKLSHSSPIVIQCRCEQIDSVFPKGSEIHLYRIIQESLSNIVKHSGATSARIEIHKKPESIEIIVEDNGRGFNTAEFAPAASVAIGPTEIARGFGIASMSERARIIGGMLKIESTADRGTTVHLAVPIVGQRT
jgi:signal transduction histidine kinase